MGDTSYEAIQPLIAAANADGATMRVTFRCPVSGTTVDASAPIRAEDGVTSRAKEGAKRRMLWSLKSAVSRAVRSALGHGVVGSAASGAAYGAMSDAGSGRSYSDAEKRQAVVDAFDNVRHQFVWDAASNRFISAQAGGEVLTDFMRQLGAAPVSTPYDRRVAARMLTEIACADGNLGDEERAFLAGFVTPDLGTVDDLARMQRLSPAELAECSAGPARETMLMLGWSVACTDEELADAERARLAEHAAGLGIAPARAAELESWAKIYVVDQALGRAYPGGQRDEAAHAEVMALAQRIGLDPTLAERADIRFRKRYGLH